FRGRVPVIVPNGFALFVVGFAVTNPAVHVLEIAGAGGTGALLCELRAGGAFVRLVVSGLNVAAVRSPKEPALHRRSLAAAKTARAAPVVIDATNEKRPRPVRATQSPISHRT